jgi:hypothetical protein
MHLLKWNTHLVKGKEWWAKYFLKAFENPPKHFQKSIWKVFYRIKWYVENALLLILFSSVSVHGFCLRHLCCHIFTAKRLQNSYFVCRSGPNRRPSSADMRRTAAGPPAQLHTCYSDLRTRLTSSVNPPMAATAALAIWIVTFRNVPQ